MSYLIRMIQIGYWVDPEDDDGAVLSPERVMQIQSDGITKDLKTDDNSLSLWEISDLSELKNISISLLTSRNKPCNIWIVALDKDKISKTLEIKNTNNAETAYIRYKDKHYDIKNINLSKLIILAKIVLEALQNKNNTYYFVYEKNKEFIKKTIQSGEIELSELKGKIKEEFSNSK